MNYDLKEICKDIRCDIMTCIGHLGVGHIGGCLSVVEALAVLAQLFIFMACTSRK